MFNRQLKKNIKEFDVKIGMLYGEYNNATTDEERTKILEQAKELANLRGKLSTVKARESVLPILVPAIVGVGTTWLVLKHEKTEIIAGKAFSIATKFIRGH